MRKIDNRNLIVVSEFDEFAQATENMDFSVEDLVAYITNISQVFYWLNVESVWGRMGFVWDHLENNKGYGHFVTTQIPFTVIPSLPDGERITEMQQNFLSSTSVNTILKSNWANLNHVYLQFSGTLNADFTGAPLINTTRVLSNSSSRIYMKADFSQNDKIQEIRGTWILDDDNKYLNVCSHLSSRVTTTTYYPGGKIQWNGEGPFKLEYVFRDIDSLSFIGGVVKPISDIYAYSNVRPCIDVTAVSHAYDLLVFNDTDDQSINAHFAYRGYAIADATVPVYINYKTLQSNTRLNPSNYSIPAYSSTSYIASIISYDDTSKYSAITYYYYCPYIEDSWPNWIDGMENKLTDYTGSYIFYAPYFAVKPLPFPYTVDVKGLTHINVNWSNRYCSYRLSFSRVTQYGMNFENKNQEILERYEDFNIEYLGTFHYPYRNDFKTRYLYSLDLLPKLENVEKDLVLVNYEVEARFNSDPTTTASFVCKFEYDIDTIQFGIPMYYPRDNTIVIQYMPSDLYI